MTEKKLDPELKKEIAKIAMTASLGATVLTAPFLKGRKTVKNIHTGAGVLFVGHRDRDYTAHVLGATLQVRFV